MYHMKNQNKKNNSIYNSIKNKKTLRTKKEVKDLYIEN